MVTAGPPTRQERGAARREAIIEATLELLIEGGPRAVTHRAVARRAHVPLAATTYYFDSIDDLLAESMRSFIDTRVAELRDLEQTVADRFDLAMLRAILERPADHVIAQFSLYLGAARREPLRPIAAEALESFERLAGQLVARFSGAQIRPAAIALAALVDGLALHRGVRPLPPDEEFEIFRGAVRAMLIAAMADEDEVATWRERLAQRLQPPTP